MPSKLWFIRNKKYTYWLCISSDSKRPFLRLRGVPLLGRTTPIQHIQTSSRHLPNTYLLCLRLDFTFSYLYFPVYQLFTQRKNFCVDINHDPRSVRDTYYIYLQIIRLKMFFLLLAIRVSYWQNTYQFFQSFTPFLVCSVVITGSPRVQNVVIFWSKYLPVFSLWLFCLECAVYSSWYKIFVFKSTWNIVKFYVNKYDIFHKLYLAKAFSEN